MIVKNEEANLPACLLSAADLFDEIVVVDTGSSDQTKEVARQFGAKVFDFPWVDSFAAARNESLAHAMGEWIFWLDADDRLDEENRDKLKRVFANLKDENAAYAMKCRCLPDPDTGTATVVDHVRLFRNRPEIRWRYRVHEQVLPAIRRLGGEVRAADVVIQHVGYQDHGVRAKKHERDLRLLQLDRADNPDDPFTLFNLGWSFEESGRPAEALPFLQRSLELSHPADSIVRKLYTLIVECHRKLKRPVEALAVCQSGRRGYPQDAQLLFMESLLHRELGNLSQAEASLLELIGGNEGAHFASIAEGLRGPAARHNLAIVYREQGRLAEAEAQWRAALAQQAHYTPAWLGLGELYLAQGRLQELETVIRRVEGDCGATRQAAAGSVALKARAQLGLKDFGTARRTLEEALVRFPVDPYLWVLLSHALLQGGQDWAAAERALRRVLELEPQNDEARRNLEVLMLQLGRDRSEVGEHHAQGERRQ
jgi:tetratricopeptide (TPR) repeat protein